MLAFLAFGAIAVKFYRGASTTVVLLVRPVPKEPGAIDDPPLPPEGEQRAQQLVRMLGAAEGGGPIDAIYVSDDRRAQQTAAPLADRVMRAPVRFPASEARATGERLLNGHAGGTVLVIGGGSSVPQIIRALLGAEPGPAAAPDVGVLYVVSVPTFGHPHLVQIVF